MGELLTTGQMIDQLRVAEIAELSVKHQIPKEHGKSYKKVTKTANGDIVWMSDTGVVDLGKPLILYGHTVNWEWRILPNYVFFEKAMKALKDGKRVTFHAGEEKYQITSSWCLVNDWVNQFNWNDLMENTWTIEE